MEESKADQVSRLRLMAIGGTTRDLSNDEMFALARVLTDRDVMLEALQETLAYWTSTGFAECDEDCDCIVESVRAAIARAEAS